ncbi:DUF3124 domain-containing protein [uncultured Gimesia sp.]|uniref:DUF3124 domain-containing protein n=1 Tax=uncultured Gimesia sp. TaxID=1678688 RepID=UPI0030D82AED|tara:strand:- start:24019 stop:24654 length:636 start_codon:yes stop_codon:yes gene_type:complete
MQDENEYPNWFLWLCENWIGLLFLLGIISLVTISAVVYLDNRFAKFEDRIKYVPPRSYQPPDLGLYLAGDINGEKFSRRGSMYIPSYSHIYYHGGSPLLLETTLSIRNIDSDQPVYLNSIDYFNTDGKLVESYLDRTIKLEPFQTIEFLVEERDSSGGSGANFLVNWTSEETADKPLMEAVMIGTAGSRAIAFSRSGVEMTPSKQNPAGKK